MNPSHRFDVTVHVLTAVFWMGLALAVGLKLALLGNEEASLRRQGGLNFKARTDLSCKQDRLRATIERLTSPTSLEETARTVVPTLEPPFRAAYRTAGQSSVAMTSFSR